MQAIVLRGRYGKGKTALVDDEDFDKVSEYKWFLSSPLGHPLQYVRCRRKRESDCRLHRLIMNAKPGDFVDHINGDTLDNRRSNLRICTNTQNQYNSRTHRDKNPVMGQTIPKGIKYDHSRPNRPWVGRISHNGRRICTKGYSALPDAIKAYNKLASRYYGPFAHLHPVS